MSRKRTIQSTLAITTALLVTTGALAAPAAGATDDDGVEVETGEAAPASSQTCLQVYIERQVGPVTVTYDCGFHVDYDENWGPGADTASQPLCYELWGEPTRPALAR